jgi:hypothetical protein
MPLIPWWVLLSSGSAPVVLVGGWSVASMLQPAAYNPLTQTISSLAAHGAADRWLMTLALATLGVCHIVTAYGITVVKLAGRIALVCGGLAALFVSVSPEPDGGVSTSHIVSAGAGFAALAVWPWLALDRRSAAPWSLRLRACVAASSVLFVASVWFLIELHGRGDAGLAERCVTAIQTLWPLIVAVNLWRASPVRRRSHEAPTAADTLAAVQVDSGAVAGSAAAGRAEL